MCWADAFETAVQQLHAEAGFKIGQLLAESGLRHMELACRPGHVAEVYHFDEIAQLPKFHGRPSGECSHNN